VNLIVPAKRPDCVAGAIIMEPTEYPPMSGSNTMCVATVLLETGMAPSQEPRAERRRHRQSASEGLAIRRRVAGVTVAESSQICAFSHRLRI